MMTELVAIDLPLSLSLVKEIQRCLDAGRAFTVLDPRDSPERRRLLLDALAPTAIVDSDGRRSHHAGRSLESGDAAVVVTSGSTGTPKAAIFTLPALLASSSMTRDALATDGEATWYACLPAYHVGGLAVILRSLLGGDKLIIGSSDDVAQGPALGATHCAVVATLLARHDLRGYERVLVGAGPAPEHRQTNVVTSWGMTETGSGVVYDGHALSGVELAIDGEQLLVRSPTLARAYRHGPLDMAAGPDGRGDWLATGDAATLNDGRLQVSGRLSTMINSGGEKLWPVALEEVLRDVDDSRDWVALGEPDSQWGQRLVVVVTGDGDHRALLASARHALERRFGVAAKPKALVVLDAIPRTSNGKVKYDTLRELVAISPRRLTAE